MATNIATDILKTTVKDEFKPTVPLVQPSTISKPNQNGDNNEPVFKVPTKTVQKPTVRKKIKQRSKITQRRHTEPNSNLDVNVMPVDAAKEDQPESSQELTSGKFFKSTSPWMKLHLLNQPPTRFAVMDAISEQQSEIFNSLLELESNVFSTSVGLSSCQHLRTLSTSTSNAASELSYCPMITQVYTDHINHYRKLDPLSTLVAAFTTQNQSHASQVRQRFMSYRMNRIRDRYTRMYRFRADTICPSAETQSQQILHNGLEETGREIYRQMKLYMDFLSVNKTSPSKTKPALAENDTNDVSKEQLDTGTNDGAQNGVQIPHIKLHNGALTNGQSNMDVTDEGHVTCDDVIGDEQTTPSPTTTDKKEEGEITDDAERVESADDNTGTYSPSPAEIEESHFRVEICPKLSTIDENTVEDETESAVVKKKKKKRKKTKSESDKKEHKKKHKKDKKREKSPEELPRAYSMTNNRYMNQPNRPFRPYGFRPYGFRGHNHNQYHNQGFRNMRYNNNFRFQNRGNFRPYHRPYGNNYFSRPLIPASHRHRDQNFVSESSSDDDRRSKPVHREHHSGRSMSASPKRARNNSTDAPVQNSDLVQGEEMSTHTKHVTDDPGKQTDGVSTPSTNLLSEFV